MATLYDDRFFDWVDQTARRSARLMLPLVQRMAKADSVVDVGCGRGTWLAVWKELGMAEVMGLDGDYVDRARLAIAPAEFVPTDLRTRNSLSRRFDLAQSLEVAEHLPASSATAMVDRLCALSDVVLFSAAQPGQGGEDHINERHPSYWAGLFAERGYVAFDCLRPLMREQRAISPWYRYNSIVFANASGWSRLSTEALASRVTNLSDLDGTAGADLGWKLRRAVLRPLPVRLVTVLSRLNYTLACTMARRSAGAPT